MNLRALARTAGTVLLVAVGQLLATFLLLMVSWKTPEGAYSLRWLPSGHIELVQPWWADAAGIALYGLCLPLYPLVRLLPNEIRPNGGWEMVMNALLWGAAVAWGLS